MIEKDKKYKERDDDKIIGILSLCSRFLRELMALGAALFILWLLCYPSIYILDGLLHGNATEQTEQTQQTEQISAYDYGYRDGFRGSPDTYFSALNTQKNMHNNNTTNTQASYIDGYIAGYESMNGV